MRARQQAAVVQLGQRALAGTDLSLLMDEAVTLVAQTVEVEYSKILELLPGGNALLLRAGVGWKEGSVGHATVAAETGSQAGYTLLSSEPVIVRDLRTETRFRGPPLLHDHGVVSGMSVIIHGRERPFGVLGAHTSRRRTFSQDDVHFLQAVANVLAEAIERKRAEEALRESEERYRSLFQEFPISLWEEDFSAVKAYIDSLRHSGVKDFRRYFEDHPEAVVKCAAMVKIVDVSEATLDLYKAEDRGQFREGLATVFGEESYEVFRQELIAIADGKSTFESEAITQTLAGDKIHVRLKLAVAPGYEETLEKVLVSIIDISERKRAEEALRESEERYRLLAEKASDVIWTTDMNLKFTYMSPAVTRLRGYSVEEVMAQTMEEALTPASLEIARKVLGEELAIEQMEEKDLFRTRTVEVEEICKDGSTVWVEIKMTFLRDRDGQPVGVLGVTRDISERKRAEQALRESEEKWRSLVENAPNFIVIVDREGTIRFINAAIAGFKPEDAIGRSIYDFVHPEYHAIHRERIEQLFRTGQAKSFESVATHLDGRVVRYETHLGPIKHGGQVVAATLIAIDISERKRAEEALSGSEERIRQLSEVASGGVSLTPRQKEVLEHVVDGRTNEEIARRLVVSRRTVERHVAAILEKLDVENRAAAAALAVAAGLARVKAKPT